MRYSLHFPVRAISKDNEKIFGKHGRPFLSKKFKDFEKTLQFIFHQQRPPEFKMLEGDLHASIIFTFDSKVHCDLQNLPKGFLDAFQGEIYKNDKQIKSMTLDLYYGDECSIDLVIQELPNDKK